MNTSYYEKCRDCWHFIEPNDADPGFTLAEHVHLDNGEKEHDHDAAPSGDTRQLNVWRTAHPELFTAYADGKIGPNSAHFAPVEKPT
jgi:hypothetical protein